MDVGLMNALISFPKLLTAKTVGRWPRFHAAAAFKLLDLKGFEVAVQFVHQHVPVGDRSQIVDMLKVANAESDQAWLASFNHWLSLKNAAAVDLTPGTNGRFFRLCAADSAIDRQTYATIGPKISVIMTAFNAAETLELAAGSILQQTWRNLELIIVSDASNDATDKMIAELAKKDSRVIGMRNAVNLGTFASKNRGLLMASGDYVTAHDSDDWALPQRLERQMEHMLGSVVGTLGDYIRLRPDGKPSRVQAVSKITADGFCQFANVSLLLKRSVALERAGFWDCLRFAADREYVDRCKILFGTDLKVTRDLTMLCLVHDKNLSVSVSKSGSWARKNLWARHRYRKAFRKWHADNKDVLLQKNLRLPFPLLHRPFAIPEKMQIGHAAQEYILDISKSETGCNS
jgi:glycosyltransferase involved in cell wall biosynthesis